MLKSSCPLSSRAVLGVTVVAALAVGVVQPSSAAISAASVPPRTTCFDASSGGAAGGVVSQIFQKSSKSQTSAAAGAFILGSSCTVSEVDVQGSFADGTQALAHSETVTFYGDSGDDFPGRKVVALPRLKGTLGPTGNLSVPLGKQRVTLQPGIYWVSVQLKSDYTPGGSGVLWQWTTTDTQTGYPGSWKNPADGTGQGCTSWTPINGCFLDNGVGLLFTVLGS